MKSFFHAVIIFVCFGLLVQTGCTSSDRERTFSAENFSFTIPRGWQTLEEIWGQEQDSQEYYGLGVQRLVMIQYPARKGQGKAFFAVAAAPLLPGEDLQSRFTQTYASIQNETENVFQGSFSQGDLSGYEITYQRPWGEPWWQFRDIWLAKDGIAYVISCHAPPASFSKYEESFSAILASFSFSP